LEGTKKKNNSIQVKVSDGRHFMLCLHCVLYSCSAVTCTVSWHQFSAWPLHDPFWPNFAFFFVRTPSGQFVCQICSF